MNVISPAMNTAVGGLVTFEACCVGVSVQDVPRFTHAFLSRLGTYSRNTLVLSLQVTWRVVACGLAVPNSPHTVLLTLCVLLA